MATFRVRIIVEKTYSADDFDDAVNQGLADLDPAAKHFEVRSVDAERQPPA